jgi:hypothetical protein
MQIRPPSSPQKPEVQSSSYVGKRPPVSRCVSLKSCETRLTCTFRGVGGVSEGEDEEDEDEAANVGYIGKPLNR